jgi:hypothetical protein
MTDKEKWSWIDGYLGRYKVSTHGRILSFATSKPKILHPTVHKSGNIKINLMKNGEMKTHFLGRLVYESFMPRLRGQTLIHIDDDLRNNRLNNLQPRRTKDGS